MSNIRKILLSEILSSKGFYEGKYTESLNILKAIIKLESKETSSDKLGEEYFDRFKQIENNSINLHSDLGSMPLSVAEQFFIRNSSDLSRYLYMEYRDNEIKDMKVIELYNILEEFFLEMYILAVEIADHYSLEIKLKKDNKGKEDIL